MELMFVGGGNGADVIVGRGVGRGGRELMVLWGGVLGRGGMLPMPTTAWS